RDATLLAHLREAQGLLPRLERPPRDVQAQIEHAQLEVTGGDVGDDGRGHGAPAPLGRQQFGTSRLGGAAVAAPEVQLPRRRALKLDAAYGARRESQRLRRALPEPRDL